MAGNGGAEAPQTNNLPPNSLFSHCKIVSCSKGKLTFLKDNLEKVVEAFGAASPFPVATLSIIGPKGSGKSFLTNLLIQYFIAEGDGGWFLNLTRKNQEGALPTLTGFHWDSLENVPENVFAPGEDDLSTSGIYLWPQPFVMEGAGKRKLLVWILHICQGKDEDDGADDDMKMLERFLMLSSSRLAEINLGNPKLQILEERMKISWVEEQEPLQDLFCTSVVFIFRGDNIPEASKAYMTDKEVKKILSKMISCGDNNSSVMDSFKHINILHVKHAKGSLHDGNGCLNPEMEKNVKNSLKKIISVISEESEIFALRRVGTNGEELRIENFTEFLESCVEVVNQTADFLNVPDAQLSDGPLEDEAEKDGGGGNHKGAVNSLISRATLSSEKCREVHDDCVSPGTTHGKRRELLSNDNSSFSSNPRMGANSLYPNLEREMKEVQLASSESKTTGLSPDDSTILSFPSPHGTETVSLQTHNHQVQVQPDDPVEEMDTTDNSTINHYNNEQQSEQIEEDTRRKLLEEEGKRKQLEFMEEQRRKEEQERQVSIRTAALKCKLKFDRELIPTTKRWLLSYLSPSNVTEIRQTYDDLRKKFQEEFPHPHPVDSSFWREVGEEFDTQYRERFFQFLTEVETRLLQFNSNLKKKLDLFAYFPHEEFTKLADEQFIKVSHDLLPTCPEIFQLVKIGCEKLVVYHRATNDNFNLTEGHLASRYIPKVIDFYNEEMKEFLSKDIYDRRGLEGIHHELVDKLLNAFRSAFGYDEGRSKVCESVEAKMGGLERSLNQEFTCHSQINSGNLRRVQGEISKSLDKTKESYQRKIDRVLEENPEGLEVKSLEAKHKSILGECKKLLEMEIRNKIRRTEPLEEHIRSFEAHADKHWRRVWEENSGNLRKAKDQRGKEMEERKRQQNKHRERESTRLEGAPLVPLVFHLYPKYIMMGTMVNGVETVLRNESGQESTPFFVGVTKTGKFVYGREAESSRREGDLQREWEVAKKFHSGEQGDFTEVIKLTNGESISLSVEFLLGFILNRLKGHVETQLRVRCSEAVITVPFSFSRRVRKQVQVGGNLAGFSEVHIFNDAYVAGLACGGAGHQTGGGGGAGTEKIIVLSEHDDKVDASMYNYESAAKKLNPVGNFGNSRSSRGSVGLTMPANLEQLFGLLKTVAGGERGKSDRRLQIVRELCRLAQERLDEVQNITTGHIYRPFTKLFVLSESEEWRPLFFQVGKERQMKICHEDDERNAMIVEAVRISQNPGAYDRWDDSCYQNVNMTQEYYDKLRLLIEQQQNPNQRLKRIRQDVVQEVNANVRQLLLKKCSEMTREIRLGTKFKFRSDLARDLFMKRVSQGLSLAQDPGSSQEQLQAELEAMVSWGSKYIK